MGFNSFPGFPKKNPIPESVAETYPKTGAIREHAAAITKNVEASEAYFDKNMKKSLRMMFERDSAGRYKKNLEQELLTESEITDLKNYISFAAKRLASGAVASEAFHEQVWKGRPGHALDTWAPPVNVGHDSMHALFAYARTGGASLVPAYMKLPTEKDAITFTDVSANLEEAYVISFANMQEMRDIITNVRTSRGLEGEELVQAVIEKWENDNLYEFPQWDLEEVRKNRLPEFVNIVRNLSSDMQKETPDPNFAVHEFQRIAEPLLQRLRESPETT